MYNYNFIQFYVQSHLQKYVPLLLGNRWEEADRNSLTFLRKTGNKLVWGCTNLKTSE